MPKHLNTADDFEMVAIERLKQHPNNVNEADTGAVIESIKAHGFYGALVVQRSTCHVVAGNHRLLAARTLGFSELPVTWITCDDEMAIRLMLTDNRSTRLGRDNPAALAELLTELAGTERGLVGLGFDGDDLDQLLTELAGMPQSGLLDDADPDAIPDDAPTRVKPGELWQLGNHRLLCGDSTKAEDVASLMGGEKAAICFTSPPYNAGASAGLSGNTHTKDTMYIVGEKDDRGNKKYLELLLGFTEVALVHCEFVFVNLQPLAGNKVALTEYVYEMRHRLSDTLIWNKLHAAPMFAEKVANSQFEYIFVFSPVTGATRAIGTSDFRGNISNVYEGGAQRANEFSHLHAATFPVHFPVWIIESFTKPQDAVYEPFCGTGTTLIAAEQLGRKCYGMELEPKYCDVILSRYESCTGKTAELIENG